MPDANFKEALTLPRTHSSWDGTRNFWGGSRRMAAKGATHPSTHSQSHHPILLDKTGHTAHPDSEEDRHFSTTRASKSQIKERGYGKEALESVL